MVLLSMVSGGGGWPRKAMHGGGTDVRVVNPALLRSSADNRMLKAKLQIIGSSLSRGLLVNAANLSHFGREFSLLAKTLFPNAGSLLLARGRDGDYSVISKQDVNFDPADLNLSAPNSLVRAAGEGEAITRRTVYIPDISQPLMFLASKFDTVSGGHIARDQHELEEGVITSLRHKVGDSWGDFDIFSLRRSGAGSVAVSPVLEYQHRDPIGAIMLFGETGFLNPPVDLIALREFADLIAVPLKSKVS